MGLKNTAGAKIIELHLRKDQVQVESLQPNLQIRVQKACKDRPQVPKLDPIVSFFISIKFNLYFVHIYIVAKNNT